MQNMVRPCNAHYLDYPLERFCRSMAELDIQRITLYGCVPHVFLNHHTFDEIDSTAKLLASFGLHADVFIPGGYGYSIFAEKDSDLQKATSKYLENCICAAAYLGADTVCIRPQNGILSCNTDELIDNATRILSELSPLAETTGVRLAVGTALKKDAAAITDINSLNRILKQTDDSRIGALLDVHVMNAAAESIDEWLELFKDRIFHIFIDDGGKSGRRVPGNGVYPLRHYLSVLEQKHSSAGLTCFLDRKSALPEKDDQCVKQYFARAEDTEAISCLN